MACEPGTQIYLPFGGEKPGKHISQGAEGASVEEKCRTVPVVPLFLEALRGKKWHNWYSTALFLYKPSAFWKALARLPQSFRGKVAQLVQYGTLPLQHRSGA